LASQLVLNIALEGLQTDVCVSRGVQ
jgi:hypothetical protein